MTSDSLLLGNLELIDQSTGTPYLVGFNENTEDLGEPVPDVAVVLGQLLDGDRVSGSRSGNRTITLPILVTSQVGTKLDLTTQVNALLAAVNDIDNDGFTLTWTPAGGLPVVFDCRRGSWTRTRDPVAEAQFRTVVTLTFPALPFGRSPVAQAVTMLATGGPTQLQVDGMNTGTFTGVAQLDVNTVFEGAASAAVTMTLQGSGQYTGSAGRTISSVNLSSYSTLGVRVRTVQNTPTRSNDMGLLILSLTLTSTGGGSATGTAVVDTRRAGGPFYLAQFPFALLSKSTSPAFNPAAVTGWSFGLATSYRSQNPFDTSTTTAWLDDLRAFPSGSTSNSTAEGTVQTIPGVLGTARTPATVEVFRAPTVQSSGNLLTAVDSSLETGVGSWASTATLASSTTQALQGTHSLSATATGTSGFGVTITPAAAAMIPVTAGTVYTLIASSRANTTARSFSATVLWYDRTGTFILSNATSSSSNNATGWTTVTANVTAPSNAAFARASVSLGPTTVVGEIHYFDAIGLIPGSGQSWVIGSGTYATVASLAFTNCLVHFPPGDQDPDAAILSPLSAGSVTIADANMNYCDTFTIVGLLTASAAGTRSVTVTFTQKVNTVVSGLVTLGTTTVTASITGTQTIVALGQVVLPLYAAPTDNVNNSLVISIASAGDTWSDIALCSTRGQTILITGQPSTTLSAYVDLPDPATETGAVYTSTGDRSVAVMAAANGGGMIPSGGSPLLEPGSNRVLAASTNGPPSVVCTYYPKWLDERDV